MIAKGSRRIPEQVVAKDCKGFKKDKDKDKEEEGPEALQGTPLPTTETARFKGPKKCSQGTGNAG